jgi:hypothetical protein
MVPILNQIDTVQTLLHYFLKIDFNIFLLFTLVSREISSLQNFQPNVCMNFYLHHVFYMTVSSSLVLISKNFPVTFI